MYKIHSFKLQKVLTVLARLLELILLNILHNKYNYMY